jgi:hypothetical protein
VSDPERWSDHTSGLTAAELRALAAGRRGPEVPAVAERVVWKALAATLAASSAAAGTGAVTTGLTAAALAKPLALGMLLGAVVAGGATVYERTQHPSPEASARATAGAPLTLPSAIPKLETPAPARPSDASPAKGRGATLEHDFGSARVPSVGSAREMAIPRGSGQASFPTDASDVNVSAESRRLVAARALLRAGRPSEALRALAAVRSDFPAGALAQEREALTIEALLASGQREVARARAAAFFTQYPESPHAETLRKALK